MLINFLGRYTIACPWIDEDAFTVLTRDTRRYPGAVESPVVISPVHDGLVYLEENPGAPKHIIQEDFCYASEGIIRTILPITLGSPRRVFRCGHVWKDGREENKRLSTIILDEGMLVIQDENNTMAVDLSSRTKLENPNKCTIWDHLTD